MRGSQKSKRVSWASDGNLCQVRLFLSEDSPSLVGSGAQDHLQAKRTSTALHLSGDVSDDNLPPGFEGYNPANELKNKLAEIPLVKWRCPPRFIVDISWCVVAGEESNEAEIQNSRELRVLEAVYPRPSAIPQNPTLPPDTDPSFHDDQRTLVIPITPVEEEDAAVEGSSSMTPIPPSFTHGALPSTQSSALSPITPKPLDNSQADILAITTAALSAVAKSNGQSMIDHELLLRILSNPTLLEQLTQHQQTGSGLVSQYLSRPTMDATQTAPMLSLSLPGPLQNPPPAPPPLSSKLRIEPGSSSATPSSNCVFYPHQNGINPLVSVAPEPTQTSLSSHPVSALPPKDMNYYKSLIQQHGGDKLTETSSPFRTPDSIENPKPRDSKAKIMKPCMYYNSSKGCRNGANCVFQHERASSIPETQSAKRMKLERDIRSSQPYS